MLRLEYSQSIQIGKLGTFQFHAGFYLYVGSAMGSGGLGGRLKHHLQPALRPHWHIDYLRSAASVEEVWFVESDARREHAWASALLAMPGAAVPVPRFGVSDCRCASHLFYFVAPPQLDVFQALLDDVFPTDEQIRRLGMDVLSVMGEPVTTSHRRLT